MSSQLPIPVATRSKTLICGLQLAGFSGSNPAGHGCLSLVSVVCREVLAFVSGLSLLRKSPTECGVSECDREALIMRRSWPTEGCFNMGGGKILYDLYPSSKVIRLIKLKALGSVELHTCT
jgi:hypothetical protein